MAEAWFHSTDEMLTFVTEVLARVLGIVRTELLQILEMATYAYDWGKRRDRVAEPPDPVVAGRASTALG